MYSGSSAAWPSSGTGSSLAGNPSGGHELISELILPPGQRHMTQHPEGVLIQIILQPVLPADHQHTAGTHRRSRMAEPIFLLL